MFPHKNESLFILRVFALFDLETNATQILFHLFYNVLLYFWCYISKVDALTKTLKTGVRSKQKEIKEMLKDAKTIDIRTYIIYSLFALNEHFDLFTVFRTKKNFSYFEMRFSFLTFKKCCHSTKCHQLKHQKN